MSITCEQLDTIRTDWMGMISTGRYTVGEVTRATIEFTQLLCALLNSEGIRTTYSPHPNSYLQDMYIHLAPPGMDVAPTHVVDDLYLGGSDITLVVYLFTIQCQDFTCDTVGDLLSNIHSLQRTMVAKGYCGTCRYSDNDIKFCGLGRELQKGCTHHVHECRRGIGAQ